MPQPSQIVNPGPLTLRKCRLGRSELDRLFSVAAEGIPGTSIHLSTQRDGIEFSCPTLSELATAVEQATGSSGQDWSNLGFEGQDADRRIRIDIDLERVELHVSGQDATWVHGRRAVLEQILRKSGGHEPGKARSSWSGNLLGGGVLMAVLVVMAHTVGPLIDPAEYKNLDPHAGVVLGRGSMAMILVGGLGTWITRRAQRPLLLVTGEVPAGSWWSRLSPNEKFAAVAAGAGVISAIAAVFNGG
ncbi:hypothetical protein AB0N77_20410 [Streptomyces misionensis]|uniref:hypothetical protein n=1 Tax=Streptomyces misionensis TaxID=67331 RepID=UPI003438A039